MSILIELNPNRPDPRDLGLLVSALNDGKLIVYPTDSGYAFGCKMAAKRAIKRIRDIRKLDSKHNYTLICRDLAHIAEYARVDNPAYRILKRCTPGPFTFILPASNQVPKVLKNPSKKTIGIRVPEHPIAHAIAHELGEPLLSSSLILPGDQAALVYASDVEEAIGGQIDYLVDGQYCGFESTTVIDMTGKVPEILRQGLGDVSWLKE